MSSMKLPKTWTVNNRDEKNPEFFEIEAPVSARVIARYEHKIDEKFRKGTTWFSQRGGKGKVVHNAGIWSRRFRIRNTAYVAPDRIIIVYGLACNFVMVRVPGTMTWANIKKGLQRAARLNGGTIYGRGDRCGLENGEERFWNSKKMGKFSRYTWDGRELKKV